MLTRQTKSRIVRGFTLTEVAIVLGIVGLILGAVWVAAAAVYDNMRVKRTNEAILQVVQGVRSLYASGNSTGVTTSGADMTADLIAAGVVPQDMKTSATATTAVNAWSSTGGDFQIQNGNAAGTSFALRFANLPQKACVNMLVSNSQQAQGTGLVGAGTSIGTGTTTIAPISVGSATSTCTSATANTIFLTFALKT